MRINEAIAFPIGTREIPTHNIIDIINGTEVYFDKPGKEYFRENDKQNINDMTPRVGNYELLSFSDIWKKLLDLSIHLSDETYKKLFVIIYRLAYMLDCQSCNGKIRFRPSNEVMKEINLIQSEINEKKENINILEFLHYLDIIAWNEDVKYQSDLQFENPKKGRINNLLSMISIPLIFKNFVDNVINNKDNIENVDYTALIDIAQDFARMRGISPMSNKDLVEYLSPYLVDELDT